MNHRLMPHLLDPNNADVNCAVNTLLTKLLSLYQNLIIN